MNAIILVSHGSKSNAAYAEVIELGRLLKQKALPDLFETAFLEINDPSIPVAISQMVQKGATRILLVLNFLNSGRHVLEHIPEIVDKSKSKYPNVQIRMTNCIGQQDKMIDLYLDLIKNNA